MLTTLDRFAACATMRDCARARRMSDAVEGAEVILYGVSKRYKESANCRLEANYAHQQE